MGQPGAARAARRLLAVGLMGWSMAVWADGATPAPDRAMLLRSVESWALGDFAVPPDIQLAAPMRARVEAMARDHRARVVAHAARWLDELAAIEEWRTGSLQQQFGARYLNEMVLWQIDRVDDADDLRLLRALRDPGWCAAPLSGSAFGRWLVLLQRLPADEREAAVNAQAALLARWGQQRTELAPRPTVSWLATARAALQALRAPARPAGEPPAPPVLMWTFAVGKRGQVQPAERCALAAWVLQREPLRQAPVAEQAHQMRFALAWDATQDMPTPTSASASDDYPPVARHFYVEGKVRVEGRTSAAGIGLDNPVVVRREVTVRGLGAARPAAFDGLLDEASLRRAATVKTPELPPGTARTVEFVWRLE